ncbi:hypothetical protein JEY40_26600 [Bradyrhizobium japonicum]|uniref:hypothetical protein n=1 Tax=Bradyrhizobium japonicum TaxID=375 RepID=UPI00200E0976|nr:hypothetical protein [Bradyrhizobium japonicum]UQD69574.1 hypothetical protein JEY40_26600 [Bradyrhizobium japonicum]
MTRWAVTKRIEAGEDLKPARTEVISICGREAGSGPPPMPGLENSDLKDRYAAVEVSDGVVVGMVKGGPVDADGGFGWPSVADRLIPQLDEKPRVVPARRRSTRAA